MIIRLKQFHDNLNIEVILAPGREFFSTKCGQFSFNFSSGTAIIHF